MSAAPPYNRLVDFTEYALLHTSQPYNPSDHDAELDAIEQTVDALCSNLSLIQRDDGALANGVVSLDSLSPGVNNLMASTAYTVRGGWVTATIYNQSDIVFQGGAVYLCFVTHTADTFATDLAAGKWALLTSSGSIASSTVFSPTATIAAVNVQTAIEELDTDLRPYTNAMAHQLLGGI